MEERSGGYWDAAGRNLFSPPGRDLNRFPVRLTADEIVIDTRRLECGGNPCRRVHRR
jgi:hypothetical protein